MPEPDFGAAYEIITEPMPGIDGDPMPRLEGDSLYVAVTYAGGCAEHRFALHSFTSRDSTHLWLEHQVKAETCEALLVDEMRLGLSGEALSAGYVGLMMPGGEPPVVIRMGQLR